MEADIQRKEFVRIVNDSMGAIPEEFRKFYEGWAKDVSQVRIGVRRPARLAEALCHNLKLKQSESHRITVIEQLEL
jgi:hypothetical protein